MCTQNQTIVENKYYYYFMRRYRESMSAKEETPKRHST